MTIKFHLSLLFIFLLTGHFLSAQIIINEFSASNYSGVVDNFGEREDWVELYNVGTNTVDLGGYFLSDNINNPMKWAFPGSVSIAPGQQLLIFLSDRDFVAGNTIHAGFKLTQSNQEWLVLTAPNGTLLDATQLTYPTQMDHSRGRITDGSASWGIFLNPSPGGSNGNAYEEYASKPQLSLQAGFYNSTVTVSMTVANGETIRYTTNGSEPTGNSMVYTNPILVSQTQVIKAKSFSNNALIPPSFTEVNTYFINVDHTIPVISIAGNDLDNLLDGQSIEPIGSFELFHEDGSFWAEAYGDYNRHGNDSWAYPQRGVDYITRDQMGYESSIDAAIFPTRDRDRYQRLIIKAAANDNYPFENGAHIRDAYIHMLSQYADMEMDERTSEPCVMYLNGEYWGVYELREKVDDPDYTRKYYNQGEKWLDFIKTWGATWEEYGSSGDWNDLHDFIVSNNMANANNYQQAAEKLNMTSLADYMILNTHMVCKDWLNWNTAWWRGRNPEGEAQKWRYTLWDMDASLGHYINYTNIPNDSPFADPCDNEVLSSTSDPEGHVDLIIALMQNEDFHSLYVNRYADMNNSFFSCDYMIPLLDEMIDRIAPEMPMQINRWGGTYGGWQANVQQMRDFILTRCSFIDGGIVDCYEVDGPFPVTVNVFPENSPNAVKVNTFIPAEFPFMGDYFSGTTLTFEAIPDFDWEFDHWEVANNSFSPNAFAAVISLQLANNGEVITAFFEEIIPCIPMDCDDDCPETVDSFDVDACECVNVAPNCDDNCVLTTDSFDVNNCQCDHVPVDCDDACVLTTDSFDAINCQCENIAPTCDDACPETVDSFDVDACECVNAAPNCDDNCALTTDIFNFNTCECENMPPNSDDECLLTVDSFDAATCTIHNVAPDCNDNNCATMDNFDAINCACENTPILPPASMDSGITLCEETAGTATFNLLDLEMVVNVGSGNTVTWMDGAGQIANPEAYESTSTTIVAEIADGESPTCQTNTALVTLTVELQPFADLTLNATICNTTMGGSMLNLDALIIGGDLTGTWTDVDNAGVDLSNTSTVDFDGVVPIGGAYTFLYTTNSAVTPCVENTYSVEVFVEDCSCPSVATTVPISNLCNDSGSLDLTILQATTELGTWTITSPVSNPPTITGNVFDATNAPAGVYEVTFTLDAAPLPNCPDSSVQTITILQQPNAGIDGEVAVCTNETDLIMLASLIQNEDVDGVWSVAAASPNMPNGGAFNFENGTFDPNGHPVGNYTFVYTVENGICMNDEATAIVEILPIEMTFLQGFSCEINEVGIDSTVLQNQNGCDSVVIIATNLLLSDTTQLMEFTCDLNSVGLSEILLTNQAGCDSLLIVNTIFDANAIDTTMLTITTCNPSEVGISEQNLIGMDGCDSLIVIQTMMGDQPEAEILPFAAITCAQPMINLTAQDLANTDFPIFAWQDANGMILSNTAELSVNTAGNYTCIVTAANSGCTSSKTIEVTENKTLPMANAGDDVVLDCNGLATVLDGGLSQPNGQLFFVWQDENGATINANGEATLEIFAAGTYTLIVTNTENGCTHSDEVNILAFTSITAEDDNFSSEINQAFSGDLLSNDDLSSQNVIVTVVSNPENGVLSLTDNGTFTFIPEQDFFGIITFSYSICLVACEDICAVAMVSIEIIGQKLTIPNAFSPNEDGVNDLFVIPTIEQYSGSSLRVLNRWGEVLYEARPYLNDWDGTMANGKELSAGTYYYLLVLDLASQQTYQGALTIVR